jgi:thymidine phosphorylase
MGVWPAQVRRGRVSAIDVRAVGLALLRMGGGRARPGDVIDPRVGLTDVLGVGEMFSPERPLAVLHAVSAEHAAHSAREVAAAFQWVDEGRPALAAPVLVHMLKVD